MSDSLLSENEPVVQTVLGSVPTKDLGIVLIHETLLSVFPGAEYAPEINLDQSIIFELLVSKLLDFKRQGGGTIVDHSGMFHGRNIWLYRTLSRATGVHIVASTGLGPEEMLSGYFTTPQTYPPTPWPAEKFASLFEKEVQEGIVVPRVERSSLAGMVCSIGSKTGLTDIEVNLFKAAAQTSKNTGVPVSIQFATNTVKELDILLAADALPEKIIIGDIDRLNINHIDVISAIINKGAYAAIDHIGWSSHEGYLNDEDRIRLIIQLFEAGLEHHILLSTNAIGVAKGHQAKDLDYTYLLNTFVPKLLAAGLTKNQIHTLLVKNPQNVLAVKRVTNIENAFNLELSK